jgi:drug/metabolite transporter (DMT)-like permease
MALGLSLIGALAMLSGSMSFGSVQFALQGSEWLGVGLAMISSLSLALYMLAVRSTAQSRASAEATFAVQVIVIAASSAGLSALFQEDWSDWLQIGSGDWAIFAAFTLVVFGANITQINAIRRLGAPLVSSLQAWRLVATLLVSGLLLSEWLNTPIQLLGAAIVVLVVSWYLWSQRAR